MGNPKTRQCRQCGKRMSVERRTRRYCSPSCRQRAYRRRKEVQNGKTS